MAVLSLASWEIRSWLEFFTFSMCLVVVAVVDFQFLSKSCLCITDFEGINDQIMVK